MARIEDVFVKPSKVGLMRRCKGAGLNIGLKGLTAETLKGKEVIRAE